MDALRECEGGAWAHSQLFIWMVEHYEAVASAVVGRKVRWARLAEAAAAEGLRTRSGGVAAKNTVKSTWFRVRRAVMEQRQKAAEASQRAVQERAEEEVRQEALREAAREERARKAAENDAARRKYEETQRAAQWAREQEQKRAAEMPASAAAAAAEAARTQPGAAVRIGQVAPVFKMLEAAPLYGEAAKQPPPPPYVGPRPAGMPDNLPLEALVSLEATGRKPNGDYDFANMPGLPRKSFFRDEYEWARCCLPMIRAIPPLERSMPLKSMFNWLMSFPGMK